MTDRGSAVTASTRLRRPQLPQVTLSRERLLRRLLDARERVVLIAAPAGFGKSVLASDWLRLADVPSAWLSLDELDNDARRFITHIAGALESLDDEAATRAAGVLRGLRSGADLRRDAEFVTALEQADPRAVVVLDDVHVLDDTPALALLAGLVELNAGPRLVLLSRVSPPVPLGRLRTSGQLLELRERDLRFDADEAGELLRRLMTRALPTELAGQLHQRTEGWAAGLRMAALALDGAVDLPAAVAAFSGSHQFVADYLMEEAFARLDEPLQHFLLDTSVLGRFTADTCAAVTGTPDAVQRLADLEAANLFLVPLGSDRTWYRYHHLFAELLRFRLRRTTPEREEGLHARASEWFEEHGDIADALEHASRMRDPARLAALLDRYALLFLSRSEMTSMNRWLRRLPDAQRDGWPTLLLAIGWLRALAEREPDLQALMAAGEAALSARPPGYDDARLHATRVEFDILRAYVARFAGRYEEALQIGQALLDGHARDSSPLRGRTLFNQARARMMLGDMAQAAELLDLSITENLRWDTHYLVLTSLAQSAAVLLETTGAREAEQSLQAAVRLATERRLTRMPAYAWVMCMLGHVRMTMGDLAGALPCLEEAVSLGTMGDMPDGRANGMAGLARVYALLGRFDEAHALLLDLEAMERGMNLGLMAGDVSVLRRRHVLLAAGAATTAWTIERPAADTDGLRARWTAAGESRALCAMLEALRAGTGAGAEAARVWANLILGESESRRRHMSAAVARVVHALLTDADDRWGVLDDLLADCARRHYVTPILEIGPPLRPLLQAAMSRSLSPAARAHARLLLQRLDALPAVEGGAAGAAPSPLHGAPPAGTGVPAEAASLTDREREVLEHLVRGLSNKAIARSMFVSPETVKTHLKHIFDKLAVSRRRDAVARARVLGFAAPPVSPVYPPSDPAGG